MILILSLAQIIFGFLVLLISSEESLNKTLLNGYPGCVQLLINRCFHICISVRCYHTIFICAERSNQSPLINLASDKIGEKNET